MADNDNQQPVFNIEKIYVKDLSLEVPNSPQIFLAREQPQVNIQLTTDGAPIADSDGSYEVKLVLTVNAVLPENRTLFLVEVTQAGIFTIRNVPAGELEPVLMIGCPNILFPYARETISDAITRAGFQPVLLNPVNFEALYEARQQQQVQQVGNTNTGTPTLQ
ncbi:protein-export protein SecB [Betaproteobacteria bacterium]|nr:protein-export protein SecB [Betaproteobacteria bacterium]GHU05499.1 protein-export protein SecB [Betaproteobacteria bacterium]GHU12216.1 protein-export protein SecB [Betaproteobacteria bacterium]GHU23446.1 protein-export protein SecB [Betaproteobacteria bacterium]